MRKYIIFCIVFFSGMVNCPAKNTEFATTYCRSGGTYSNNYMVDFFVLMAFLFFLGVIATKQIYGACSPGLPDRNRFVDSFECEVQPVYHFRPDGKPGREIILHFKDKKLFNEAKVEIQVEGKKEVTKIPPLTDGRSVVSVLLPDGTGVKRDSEVILKLWQGNSVLNKTVRIPALRHWIVYIYSHAHVDIGYTNTQANVEILHKTNIEEGIKLGEATRDYPHGAKSRWNPEVTWPLERYWQTAAPKQKELVVNAVQKGHLCIDAGYLNLNTSACSDEELFQIFRFSREMQKLTGVPIDVF